MAETQQTIDNTAAIKAIQDNAKKVSQLPPLTSLVNLQDKIAMEVGATGQTVYTTIEQLKDGGVGSQVVKHPVGISFDFPLNNKTDLDSIHGAFLIPGSLSGQVLNSGQNITGSAGISKVMILALAGTVSTGSLTISGTSVDRNTSVETPGDTEIIALDGLSTDNSTTDANGNPVYNYINNYISNKWWKGTLTFSTTDLDFTDIKFAQVAFEQFGDLGELTLDSLDATYKINNNSAEMDSYMYAVEVTSGNKANLTMVAELHHATGEFVDAAYRRRIGNINRDLNALTDGVFIDLWLAPSTQAYFSSFSIKVWGTKNETINIVVDGSLGLDSIIYGENLTNGTLVYLNADGKYYKADNTAESTSTTELRLILEDGLLDEEKLALSKGQYTTTSLTAGLEYVGTNGTITNSRPTLETETVRIVSTAINATTRYFDASKTWINGTASKINGVTIAGAGTEFLDNVFKILNSTDQTKKLEFDLSQIASGETRVASLQDKDGIIAYLSDVGGSSTNPTRVEMGVSNVIDWTNPNGVFLKTMTEDIVFVDSNLPTGTDTKEINMYLDGNYTPVFPPYYILLGGNYSGAVKNKLDIQAVNGNLGSEAVYYNISNTDIVTIPIIEWDDFTFTRASQANYTDEFGDIINVGNNIKRFDYSSNEGFPRLLIEGGVTNKFSSPDTLSTQNVTTIADNYIISFYGTGTVTITGSITDVLVGVGDKDRVFKSLSATAGTATFTVTGSVTFALLEQRVTTEFPVSYVSTSRVNEKLVYTLPTPFTVGFTLFFDVIISGVSGNGTNGGSARMSNASKTDMVFIKKGNDRVAFTLSSKISSALSDVINKTVDPLGFRAKIAYSCDALGNVTMFLNGEKSTVLTGFDQTLLTEIVLEPKINGNFFNEIQSYKNIHLDYIPYADAELIQLTTL